MIVEQTFEGVQENASGKIAVFNASKLRELRKLDESQPFPSELDNDLMTTFYFSSPHQYKQLACERGEWTADREQRFQAEGYSPHCIMSDSRYFEVSMSRSLHERRRETHDATTFFDDTRAYLLQSRPSEIDYGFNRGGSSVDIGKMTDIQQIHQIDACIDHLRESEGKVLVVYSGNGSFCLHSDEDRVWHNGGEREFGLDKALEIMAYFQARGYDSSILKARPLEYNGIKCDAAQIK